MIANLVRGSAISINAKDLISGIYQSSGSVAVDSETIRAVTVSGTDVRLEADDRIDGASVVSNTLTVRGNNSVVLVGTVVSGVRGSSTFKLVELLLPFGDGDYSVNGIPFGPDEIISPTVTGIEGSIQAALAALSAAEALVDEAFVDTNGGGISLNLAALFGSGSDDDEEEDGGEESLDSDDDQVAFISNN